MAAKSMWMRCIGWLTHGQLCNGASGGDILHAAQF